LFVVSTIHELDTTESDQSSVRGAVFFQKKENRRDGAHHGGLLRVAAFLGGNPVMG
jgi:hypothetical protein